MASAISFGVRLRTNTGCLRQLTLIPCPGSDLGNVDLDRGQREHVGRRAHLDDQRHQRGDRADAGEADRGDVEEIAAADAVLACADLNPQRTGPSWPCFPF